MEVTGFGGWGEYTAGHIQLWLKVSPIASLARFHVVKTEVSYHVLLGRPWLHKYRLVSFTYHQCVKGRLNGRMIRIATNPSPFEQAEAHLVETMFYDHWAPSGESSVSKPRGTFVPKWEDVQGDPEPDLRELLARKKKRKEKKHSPQNQMTHPNVSGFEALMAELCTNYEGARGLRAKYKRAPLKSGSTRVWRVTWHKKVQGKRVMKKKMKKSWQKKSWKRLTRGLVRKDQGLSRLVQV